MLFLKDDPFRANHPEGKVVWGLVEWVLTDSRFGDISQQLTTCFQKVLYFVVEKGSTTDLIWLQSNLYPWRISQWIVCSVGYGSPVAFQVFSFGSYSQWVGCFLTALEPLVFNGDFLRFTVASQESPSFRCTKGGRDGLQLLLNSFRLALWHDTLKMLPSWELKYLHISKEKALLSRWFSFPLRWDMDSFCGRKPPACQNWGAGPCSAPSICGQRFWRKLIRNGKKQTKMMYSTRKSTFPLKNAGWKMNFPFEMVLFLGTC